MSNIAPRSPKGPHVSLQTTEPTHFGTGWISGIMAVALGGIGLLAVLCFLFPQWLTMPVLRGLYPVPWVRGLLHVVLVSSFLLGTVSVCLRRNKAFGLVGMALVLVAALLGGAQVPVGGGARISEGPFLGLDWFLLNLILYSIVYIPLERMFAHRPEQPVFRSGWKTDITYFFFNTLLIQLTSFLVVLPAMTLFDWARSPRVEQIALNLPLLVQVPLVLLIADFTQYWVHRAFHAVPMLWRFHAVHHSAEQMDWLAGSRLHLVDAVVTRGLTYVPVYVLGFSQSAIVVYLAIVVIQATFIHANVRWQFRPLRRCVATPAFHHWHHAAEAEAIDTNFAVHTPLWDLLFGTYFLPDRWPTAYGICGGSRVPVGWLRQLVHPFRRSTSPSVTAASTQAKTP